jgi:hypothetical protein
VNLQHAAQKVLMGLVLIGAASITIAMPAPWFMWQSKLDGKLVCTQTSPGPGWLKLSGPFVDARCGRPT